MQNAQPAAVYTEKKEEGGYGPFHFLSPLPGCDSILSKLKYKNTGHLKIRAKPAHER